MGLYKLTAAELHEKLVNKECSAVEIAKSVLERMEKCEPVTQRESSLAWM